MSLRTGYHIRFSYENREKLEDQYIHDSEFDGYSYDYEKREIKFTCIDRFHRRKIKLVFNNVLFSEMQCCQFWASGVNRIYDIWHEDEDSQINRLKNIPEFDESDYLNNEVHYIQVCLQILSGDTFLFICESLDWTEESLLPVGNQ